jgi:hypothetical protein
MKKWWKVIRSKTEDDLDERWAEFDDDENNPKQCKEYMFNTWLSKYRHKFVKVWTNQLLHLGAIDSSRVEGAHHTLKCYIKTRNYDLWQTWKKIKNYID